VADAASGFIIQPFYKRLFLLVNRFEREIFDPIFLFDFEVTFGVTINADFTGMRDLRHPGMALAAVGFAMGGAGISGFVDMKHLESVIPCLSYEAGKPMTGKTAALVKGEAD
jgi:hypothetical protein